MENHAKYGDTIFAHGDDALFVNLFIPAEVTWRERGIRLRQETAFPAEDRTRLIWSCDAPVELALRIRHPGWARGALRVTVNGQPQAVASAPGSYFEIRRTWRDGDRVEVQFPMSLHVENLPGSEDLVALLYGPVVLAGKLGNDDMPAPYERDQLDQARFPDPVPPAFVSADADWLGRVEMLSRESLLFRTRGLGRPHDVLLAPFFTIHHERYTVYWRLLTPAAWDRDQAAVASVEKQWSAIESTAVDRVAAGDVSSEGGHHIQAAKTDTGRIEGAGWREAQKGGFFSYELQTKNHAGPLALVCAYGSRDVGARNFEISVDGQKITPAPIDGSAPGRIVIQRYELPVALTSGKPRVTVKFQAADQWDAATDNVFGCALVPAAAPAVR